jgi:hypothetical protein
LCKFRTLRISAKNHQQPLEEEEDATKMGELLLKLKRNRHQLFSRPHALPPTPQQTKVSRGDLHRTRRKYLWRSPSLQNMPGKKSTPSRSNQDATQSLRQNQK